MIEAMGMSANKVKLVVLLVAGLGLSSPLLTGSLRADERLDLLKNISSAGAPLLTSLDTSASYILMKGHTLERNLFQAHVLWHMFE